MNKNNNKKSATYVSTKDSADMAALHQRAGVSVISNYNNKPSTITLPGRQKMNSQSA